MSVWIMFLSYVKMGILSWMVWIVAAFIATLITGLKCPEEILEWDKQGEDFKWTVWDTVGMIIWPYGILCNTVALASFLYDIVEAHRENKKYFQEN